MRYKYKLLAGFIICVLFTASIYKGFSLIKRVSNIVSSNPVYWGQCGDFFGGFLNPILTGINILILLYLTYTVSKSDDKRTLTQFRYDAYISLKDSIEKKTVFPQEKTYKSIAIYYNELAKQLINFGKYSAFLFLDNDLNKRLNLLISVVNEVCSHASIGGENELNEIDLLYFKRQEEFIELLEQTMLMEMQKRILNY